MTREDEVYAALAQVIDPEIGINVVDLGLVYGVEVDAGGGIDVLMTLTVQGCPMHDTIRADAVRALQTVPWATRCNVKLTFDPPWNPDRISPRARVFLGV
jgi:metal-sulfur cluster biosynthetic enzyme